MPVKIVLRYLDGRDKTALLNQVLDARVSVRVKWMALFDVHFEISAEHIQLPTRIEVEPEVLKTILLAPGGLAEVLREPRGLARRPQAAGPQGSGPRARCG